MTQLHLPKILSSQNTPCGISPCTCDAFTLWTFVQLCDEVMSFSSDYSTHTGLVPLELMHPKQARIWALGRSFCLLMVKLGSRSFFGGGGGGHHIRKTDEKGIEIRRRVDGTINRDKGASMLPHKWDTLLQWLRGIGAGSHIFKVSRPGHLFSKHVTGKSWQLRWRLKH